MAWSPFPGKGLRPRRSGLMKLTEGDMSQFLSHLEEKLVPHHGQPLCHPLKLPLSTPPMKEMKIEATITKEC